MNGAVIDPKAVLSWLAGMVRKRLFVGVSLGRP
jgi:hypothetical protein